MRNYSAKANLYRLSHERMKELRAFCLSASGDDFELIRDIADDTACGAMPRWIVLSVTTTQWPWSRCEAYGIPCSRQTFRIYRMRFYWLLDRYLKQAGHKTDPPGET